MRTFLLFMVLVLPAFGGCTILENLDGIFTLQGYSKESDAQHAYVKKIDAQYDALSKAIADGHMGDYKDETSFVRNFGDPILKKEIPDGAKRWLYRHAIYRFAKDKVYLYFDHNGKLIKWEQLPCQKFF